MAAIEVLEKEITRLKGEVETWKDKHKDVVTKLRVSETQLNRAQKDLDQYDRLRHDYDLVLTANMNLKRQNRRVEKQLEAVNKLMKDFNRVIAENKKLLEG